MRVFVILGLVAAVSAKFCLRDEAPTKVKIGANGVPQLICEKPTCDLDNGKMHSCTYYQSSCAKSNEWVSGVHENDRKFGIACCQSSYLSYSRVLGSTKLFPGDVFAGGAWKSKSGTRSGFDVVSNIEQISNATEVATYRVTVSRVTCPAEHAPLAQPSQLIAAVHNKYDVQSNVAGNLQGPFGNQGAFDSADEFLPGPTQQQVIELPPGQGFPGSGLGQGFGPSFGAPGGLGGLGGLGGAAGLCFSEDQLVTTPAGNKMMKDLKIGDQVLTAQDGRTSFSPVESWLHRYPEQQAEFLHMIMEDGSELKVTPEHYIYHMPCDSDINQEWTLSFANEVVPGKDCVINVADNGVRQVAVVSSEPIVAKGVYGPMTANANIVVNDLAASCYAVVKDTTMLHSLLGMAQTFDSVCDSAARAFGFKSGPQDLLNEMPKSLTVLKNMADVIFPSNWKMIG